MDIQQRSRGKIPAGIESGYKTLSLAEQLRLLESHEPCDRSLGARLLGFSRNSVALPPLCAALAREKKLYPKIEICEAIALFGDRAINNLIPLLGTIGSNHHHVVDGPIFKKKSYPLPRDIVARILIRIGPLALPALQGILVNGQVSQIREGLDAIGHISFYSKDQSSYEKLIECYLKFKDNPVVVWKIVRVFSAFPKSAGFLVQLKTTPIQPGIQFEIARSLEVISRTIGDKQRGTNYEIF